MAFCAYLKGRAGAAPYGVVVPAEEEQILPVILAHQKVRVADYYCQCLGSSEGDVKLLRVAQKANLGLLLHPMPPGQSGADHDHLLFATLEIFHLSRAEQIKNTSS